MTASINMILAHLQSGGDFRVSARCMLFRVPRGSLAHVTFIASACPLFISAPQALNRDTSSPTQPLGTPPPLPMQRDEARAMSPAARAHLGAVSEWPFPPAEAFPTQLPPAYLVPDVDLAQPFGARSGMGLGWHGRGVLGGMTGTGGGAGVGVWSGGKFAPRRVCIMCCCRLLQWWSMSPKHNPKGVTSG